MNYRRMTLIKHIVCRTAKKSAYEKHDTNILNELEIKDNSNTVFLELGDTHVFFTMGPTSSC